MLTDSRIRAFRWLAAVLRTALDGQGLVDVWLVRDGSQPTEVELTADVTSLRLTPVFEPEEPFVVNGAGVPELLPPVPLRPQLANHRQPLSSTVRA